MTNHSKLCDQSTSTRTSAGASSADEVTTRNHRSTGRPTVRSGSRGVQRRQLVSNSRTRPYALGRLAAHRPPTCIRRLATGDVMTVISNPATACGPNNAGTVLMHADCRTPSNCAAQPVERFSSRGRPLRASHWAVPMGRPPRAETGRRASTDSSLAAATTPLIAVNFSHTDDGERTTATNGPQECPGAESRPGTACHTSTLASTGSFENDSDDSDELPLGQLIGTAVAVPMHLPFAGRTARLASRADTQIPSTARTIELSAGPSSGAAPADDHLLRQCGGRGGAPLPFSERPPAVSNQRGRASVTSGLPGTIGASSMWPLASHLCNSSDSM